MRKCALWLFTVAALSLSALALSAPSVAQVVKSQQPFAVGSMPRAAKFRHISPSSVFHGRPAISVPFGKQATASVVTNMTYHGGPIQQDPQVFVVFWGAWWDANPVCPGGQTNGDADEQYLSNFYHALGSKNDNISPISSQYFQDAKANYPTFPTLAGHSFVDWNVDCTDPPQSATNADLAAEAVSYAGYLSSEGYSIDGNTQIVIVSPTGDNPGGGFGTKYCAFHATAQYSSTQSITYTNLPYQPDQGSNCGANDVSGPLDGWSINAGHEFEETVTDPQLNAWYDGSLSGEIGDKCSWQNLFLAKMGANSFAMQPEWNNAHSSCADFPTYLSGQIKLQSNTTFCAQASSTASDTPVTLFSPCDKTSARTWVRYPDGSLRRWKNTGQCMYPQSFSPNAGAPLVLTRCDNDNFERWSWNSTTGRWKNKATGLCLRSVGTPASGEQLSQDTCGLSRERWTNV
jgi:hypothetical protein